MMKIVKIEIKRILGVKTLMMFLLIVMVFSIYSTCSDLRHYDNIYDLKGNRITWNENLNHAKKNLQGICINREFLNDMRQKESEAVYTDEWNLEEIIAVNYEGKSVRDLSDEDIGNFYIRRLSNIRTMLEENQKIHYTEKEMESLIKEAEQLSEIKFGYAEGWNVLNDDMNTYIPLLLIVISILLLPLFGTDSKSNMKELYRGTKYGKKPLDYARILASFIIGGFLYALGIMIYFFIKMIPFGLEGWNQNIQSNADMFFSIYNIANWERFMLNVIIGLAALLFVVSLVLLITIVMEKIMTSAVVYVFFWILLLLFDQMYLWPINHYFANFMPLRMTSFTHYYTGNEIYRIFGYSLSCMTWSILLSSLLAGILLLSAIGWQNVKKKKGLY